MNYTPRLLAPTRARRLLARRTCVRFPSNFLPLVTQPLFNPDSYRSTVVFIRNCTRVSLSNCDEQRVFRKTSDNSQAVRHQTDLRPNPGIRTFPAGECAVNGSRRTVITGGS